MRRTRASQSMLAKVVLPMGDTFSPSFLNPNFSKHVSTVSCNTFPNCSDLTLAPKHIIRRNTPPPSSYSLSTHKFDRQIPPTSHLNPPQYTPPPPHPAAPIPPSQKTKPETWIEIIPRAGRRCCSPLTVGSLQFSVPVVSLAPFSCPLGLPFCLPAAS